MVFLYAFFPTKHFYWDGIFFSQVIEDAPELGSSLIHPNHLIYNVLGYLLYRTVELAGLPTRAVYVLQAFSITFGVLTAAVFYAIANRVLRSFYLSFFLTAILAFSATWWKFSTDCAVYIPCIFFLVLCFYFLLPQRRPHPILLAGLHTSAMLLHELAVLFVPSVVLGLFLLSPGSDPSRRVRAAMIYLLCAFVLTFGSYVFCFYLLYGSFDLGRFFSWIVFYASDTGFTGSFWNNLLTTLKGNRQLITNAGSGFRPNEPMSVVLMILLGASAVLLGIITLKYKGDVKTFWRSLRNKDKQVDHVILLCVAWILPYLVFLFFFLPDNTFYRLFYFPALILLLGAFLSKYEALRPVRRWRLALLSVIIILSNFLFFIRPHSRVRENTVLDIAMRGNSVWSSRTVVFYEELDTDNRIVKYFNRAVVWKPLNFSTSDELSTEIKEIRATGGDVWLDLSAATRLRSAPESAVWLENNRDRETGSELTLPKSSLSYLKLSSGISDRQHSQN